MITSYKARRGLYRSDQQCHITGSRHFTWTFVAENSGAKNLMNSHQTISKAPQFLSCTSTRQMHGFFNSSKIWWSILCWYTCFYKLRTKRDFYFCVHNWQNNFRFTTCRKHVRQQIFGINFWLHWRNYGAVSYPFSCKVEKKYCGNAGVKKCKCDFIKVLALFSMM